MAKGLAHTGHDELAVPPRSRDAELCGYVRREILQTRRFDGGRCLQREAAFFLATVFLEAVFFAAGTPP